MNGRLLVIDAHAELGLTDREFIRSWCHEAIALAGMSELAEVSVRLDSGIDSGPGISVLMLIAESHLAVHTWPETRSVYMEFSSCKEFDVAQIVSSFTERFIATVTQKYEIERMDVWGHDD